MILQIIELLLFDIVLKKSIILNIVYIYYPDAIKWMSIKQKTPLSWGFFIYFIGSYAGAISTAF